MARGNVAVEPMRAARAAGRREALGSQVNFAQKLILYQWLLSLFGVECFEQLAEHLRDEELEGLDEDNVHRFCRELILRLPAEQRPQLPDELLLEYDQVIVSVTQRLNERRIARGEPPIVWKYYQYLALLFTEIYLERYFRDPRGLLTEINRQIAAFNAGKQCSDRIAPLDEAADPRPQLNKLAFWMATGSGKTLLMHAHILMYLRLLDIHGRVCELNRIILLTPNEGLSRQHLSEFEAAGIQAELFTKNGPGLYARQTVEIIEVTKLKDEAGAKTVAVEAFEGNNLVLVDEGHRGASAGEEGAWMRYRNLLCEKGFSFEYSATFGQAVKGNQGLTDLYARSILFDYSYYWFHRDGFGKEYQILNLEDDSNQEWLKSYLTACLLVFFQQQRLYHEYAEEFRPFNLERPLLVFVGGSVTATLAAREASDIVSILRFLAEYVSDRAASIARIRQVLNEGLVTASGKNLFAGRFAYLNNSGLSASQVFDETLTMLFNAAAGGALHIENLRGIPGEIALRVGENEPFGVVNVGDDAKLLKLCDEQGLDVGEREFSDSLFHQINQPDSSVNILIGSRKFTEGWNSWRVSTMGLMHVGRGEGAQIIQLFGRGVRLKGYGMSLKRSASLNLGIARPKYISALETLNVFGIRADYMAQFREFLKDERLPENPERLEFVLPIKKGLRSRSLKIVRLKKAVNGIRADFRKLGRAPVLQPPDKAGDRAAEYLRNNQVVLNWYPKIQAMKSGGVADGNDEASPNETHLQPAHIAFLDLDRLFFELERFKAERGWHNLNLTRSGIAALLADTSWYRLQIPEAELAFDSFEKVSLWQEIALALLKKYTERYYTFRKREWELPHLEYQDLTEDDPNFLLTKEDSTECGYRISIDKSQAEIIDKLEQLKAAIEAGDLRPWEFRGIKAIWFSRHLYQPLLCYQGEAVEISPVPLNEGECRFVEDLKAFYEANQALFAEKELYLLRNLSRGRGVGFFEAGNFYPDFILWILAGERQCVIFVDPKGLRQVGVTDPKLCFYQTVKEIEARLGDANVTLDSYIVSPTPSYVMEQLWGIDKPTMRAHHIVFQEDRSSYIAEMLHGVLK